MTACRYSHVGIVEMMISEKYRSRIELLQSLREATLSGYGDQKTQTKDLADS
jgi:hypothetical protein